MGQPNLFDGRLLLLYWTPRSVTETSIAQLADNIRQRAPNITGVCVKVNNGRYFQGGIDASKPDMAITSLADVRRWVDVLATRGLECHAWGVLRGIASELQAELNMMVNICLTTGVRSYIMDLEPWQYYFEGDRNAAVFLSNGLRERIGPEYHLGLCFDYRANRPRNLWVPDVWLPNIDSLHPMVYHYHFGQTFQTAMQQCVNVIGGYGRNIYPMMQGYSPGGSIGLYPPSDIPVSAATAVNTFGARGLTWFRYGRGLHIADEGIGPNDLAYVAQVTLPSAPPTPTPPPPPPIVIGTPPPPADGPRATVIVDPNNETAGEFVITYYGDPAALAQEWRVALDVNGRPYAYRNARYYDQQLYVTYRPRLHGRGRYVVEAFIPNVNATVRDAYYTIVHHPGGVRQEVVALINQNSHANVWVPLTGQDGNGQTVSVFDLEPTNPESGRVNLADITFTPGGPYPIAFGAIRWRPAEAGGPASSPPEWGGLDAPIGTEAERAGPLNGRLVRIGNQDYPFWVGQWFDYNTFGTRYWLGNRWAIHTGADLNLTGGPTADAGAPVYAIGEGRVVCARRLSSGWGEVIVVEHPIPPENRVVWARYAHLSHIQVREGDTVQRGQPLARIGEYAPGNFHLHFDIATDSVLARAPGHWPGDDEAAVRRLYTDPLAFLRRHHRVRQNG